MKHSNKNTAMKHPTNNKIINVETVWKNYVERKNEKKTIKLNKKKQNETE